MIFMEKRTGNLFELLIKSLSSGDLGRYFNLISINKKIKASQYYSLGEFVLFNPTYMPSHKINHLELSNEFELIGLL